MGVLSRSGPLPRGRPYSVIQRGIWTTLLALNPVQQWQ